MGLAANLLRWSAKVTVLQTDNATAEGPIVLIQTSDGTLVRCRALEAKTFKIFLGGQPHEHVANDVDGTWIYAARPY